MATEDSMTGERSENLLRHCYVGEKHELLNYRIGLFWVVRGDIGRISATLTSTFQGETNLERQWQEGDGSRERERERREREKGKKEKMRWER